MKILVNILLLTILTLSYSINLCAESINMVSPKELKEMLDSGEVDLIDVRESDEFLSKHIEGAKNIPLSILDKSQICNMDKKIVLQCNTGRRSHQAALKLKEIAPNLEIYDLQGGFTHLEEGDFHIVKTNKFPIMRQVQIVAGSIILIGVLLAIFISNSFLIIPLFVGCGLIFAGISGWCGMAKLLSYMPWN